MAEMNWEPVEEAQRWVEEGRVREVLAILPELGTRGAIVEQAVIDGGPLVVDQLLKLLHDQDLRIAARASSLLGERAFQRGLAPEVEAALLQALTTALASDPARVSSLAAALRECARVGGARAATRGLCEIVRRNALGDFGDLELMWATEALLDLGWSADRIMTELGHLEPQRAAELRGKIDDIDRGLKVLAQARRDLPTS